jgi:hypothetical protein
LKNLIAKKVMTTNIVYSKINKEARQQMHMVKILPMFTNSKTIKSCYHSLKLILKILSNSEKDVVGMKPQD